jgi:hypothetical protein
MRRHDPHPSAPAAAVLQVAADPTDPNRCVVRFGAQGPSRNLGASPERVVAFLEGEDLIQRALPELGADEREFLLFGADGPEGERAAAEGDPNLVTIEADPSDPNRSRVRFVASDRQRTVATSAARLAAVLGGRLEAHVEVALPELDADDRAFVHEGLAALSVPIPHVEVRTPHQAARAAAMD